MEHQYVCPQYRTKLFPILLCFSIFAFCKASFGQGQVVDPIVIIDSSIVTSLQDGDNFGISVAHMGDLDGDTFPDLAVGANGDDDGGPDRGAVYLLFTDGSGNVDAFTKISDTAGGFSGGLQNAEGFGNAVEGLLGCILVWRIRLVGCRFRSQTPSGFQ